jgi:acetylornithine deacetylase
MDQLFALARTLIDVESITLNEAPVGHVVYGLLEERTKKYGGTVERIEVEPNRFNVLAIFGTTPTVTLTTHLDTVPPFFASREDDEFIWGRGACDVKGIIACMITAADQLLEAGVREFGLMFVVGEERNSAGAYFAAKHPRGSKFLINGEPTENKLALGSKGAHRFEIIARGRMAHSAYPELGDSAINKLLDALERIRCIDLEHDELLGPSTLNIGQIEGGRAPNVISDYAKAELMIRLVDLGESTRARVLAAAGTEVEAKEILCIPAMHFGRLPGFATMVAAYTTDIPAFGGAWGQPYLLGPGTIHVAHTSEERVPKVQLVEAVGIYRSMVRQLLSQ